MPAFVYLLRCRDGSLYCGWTDDLDNRLTKHNTGKGAAYTRSRRPVRMVWHEACTDRSAALKREWAIKQLTRVQKLALVATVNQKSGRGLRLGSRRRIPG